MKQIGEAFRRSTASIAGTRWAKARYGLCEWQRPDRKGAFSLATLLTFRAVIGSGLSAVAPVILQVLLDAHDESGSQLTDEELRGEMMTLFYCRSRDDISGAFMGVVRRKWKAYRYSFAETNT